MNKDSFSDVNIDLGPKCNLSCLHCAVNFRRNEKNRDFTSIINEIIYFMNYSSERLVLTGGEPCLRKDLTHIIAFAKCLGFKNIHIQTNATLLYYPKIVKNLIASGLNSSLVSLLGHNKEIHEKITSRPGSFERTSKGIKNLLCYPGFKVSVNIVISPYNYYYLKNIIELIISEFKKINTICISYPQISGGVLKNFPKLTPKISSVSAHLIDAINLAKENEYWVWISDYPLCYIQGFEEHSSHIFPRVSMVRKSTIVNQVSFMDISHPEKELRKLKAKSPYCEDCLYNDICIGVDQIYLDYFGDIEFQGMERKV